ncbi:unnamed protein product [Phytophthora fragariaefolia]|uniref:Unnamed protein product n=1 Tax=Phytophthora fragariaefolia TaxID=1490495 RepID=A0A9W7CTU4_9STRA|nr:unnamed protein product [Phytophthora fragariaefolia]
MMGSRNANSPLAPPETNETAVATTSHNRHEEYVVTAAEVPSSGDATTNIVFPMASPSAMLVPSHVTTSIREYVPPAGFTILPKRRGERSIIRDWGVRLSSVIDGKEYTGWICLGSHECRQKNELIRLFGNTSKATKHLSDVHLLAAPKVTAEITRKKNRAERLERIRVNIKTSDDSRRMALLLETLRVINNNLPFRIGEYEKSELLADFTLGDEFRVTFNKHTVTRCIVELYASAHGAVCIHIDLSRIRNVASFTIVCDLLSSKTQKGTKYIGVRLYFIDKNWKFQSILLGTRHYEPMYGERSDGSRGPLERWIMELLKDFGLSAKDLFASTSDADPDVKWMMRRGFALKWEWCVPHLTNAATKSVFGIVPQRQNSKNPEATDLISRIARTIYAIRSNSSMGSLFRERCEMVNNGNNSKSTELVEHKDHRFMGLAKVIRRLLEKWEQLEDWFQERINKAIRERKPAPESLPIADDKETLLQLYGLLGPIAALNTKSQKEDANQCEVLLSMFRLRTTVLDETQPIKDKMREASKPPLYYQVRDLTRLTKNTRALLAKQFYKNFFIRYTDRARVRDSSYIPEMQMLLHPLLKNQDNNLAKIVRLCNEQLVIDPEQPHLRLDERTVEANVSAVKSAVVDRLRDLLLDI